MIDAQVHRWEEEEDRLRAEWERAYPNVPWNDVRLGYRYGWEQAGTPGYAGRDWSSAEADLRAAWGGWETSQGDSTAVGRQLMQDWEDLKESVRLGWEKARATF